MKRKIYFAVTAIVLFLFSWADVLFFGTAKYNTFGVYTNQVAHMFTLLLAAVLGHFYWKKGWVRVLWDGLYLLVIFTVIIASLVFLKIGDRGVHWNQIVAQLRNNFEGPLPFLVFGLFAQLSSQLLAESKAKAQNDLPAK